MATAGQKRAHGQSPDWADEVVEKGDIFLLIGRVSSELVSEIGLFQRDSGR